MADTSLPGLKKLLRYTHENGISDTCQRTWGKIAATVFEPMLHRSVSPSLHWLANQKSERFMAVQEVFPNTDLSEFRREFSELEVELEQRCQHTKLAYPRGWSVRGEAPFLLFSLVRMFKPERLVESGIANGVSTFFLTKAILANGHGRLMSIDPDPGAGCLINGQESPVWDKRILNSPFKSNFASALSDGIDFFLHDSDHSYGWVKFEFETVIPKLRRPAMLLCDDADRSLAFVDVCVRLRIVPKFMVGSSGLFGFAFLSEPSDLIPSSPPRDSIAGNRSGR
jgi:predicted O-methyltransferase YrrM